MSTEPSAHELDPGRAPRRAAWALVVLGLLGAAAWAFGRRGVEGTEGLDVQLEDLGRVAVVGGDDLLRLRAEGASLVPARDVAGLQAALEGTDEEALARCLQTAGVGALLADGRVVPAMAAAGERAVSAPDADPAPGIPTADAPAAAPLPLRDRLARFDAFEQLQALYLAPSAALYVPRSGLVVRPPFDQALAYVARGIVGGARPPRVASFPEPLRRIRNVEVMVLLTDTGRPRLWRSARGSSIARALLTAATVARQRWMERAPAMGGGLDTQLRGLDVEVALLDEDGTLGSRTPAFIERVFTPAHGVAFDDLGTWRYLLPDATRDRGEGSAVRAYGALFEDSDMEPESLTRPEVRLYRLLARSLARSPAPDRPSSTPVRLPHDGALDAAPTGLEAFFPEEHP